MSHHNCVIEYIARKSLVCLALTFVVNLIMNLFKVTTFLGDRSDVSRKVNRPGLGNILLIYVFPGRLLRFTLPLSSQLY